MALSQMPLWSFKSVALTMLLVAFVISSALTFMISWYVPSCTARPDICLSPFSFVVSGDNALLYSVNFSVMKNLPFFFK